MPERRFSEEEVGQILRKAASLQIEGSKDPSGVSLGQLKQAANELGIAENLIDEALLDEDSETTGKSSLFKGPAVVQVKSTVQGTFDPSDWPAILSDIRTVAGSIGQTTEIGQSFEWVGGEPPAHVSLNPEDGHTTVHVFIKNSEVGAFMLFMGTFLSFAISMAIIMPAHLGALRNLIGILALVSVGHLALRMAYARLCRLSEKRARRILKQVVKSVEERASDSLRSNLAASSPVLETEANQILGHEGS